MEQSLFSLLFGVLWFRSQDLIRCVSRLDVALVGKTVLVLLSGQYHPLYLGGGGVYTLWCKGINWVHPIQPGLYNRI